MARCRDRLTAATLGVAALIVMGTLPAQALDLTGVLAYRATLSGETGPFWHTLTGASAGRPLAITDANPTSVRVAPLANAWDRTIDIPLTPGSYIFTALWQYVPGEFPLVMMVLNLFFDGDMATPAISAVIPSTRSFTQRQPNPMTTTRSLALAEVPNNASLFYDDGTARVALGAAFFLPGIGPTDRWQSSDFVGVDRVGISDLLPDGESDGVLIFELVVTSSSGPPAFQSAAPHAAQVEEPGAAQLGPDLWRTPTPPDELLPGVPSHPPVTARSPQETVATPPTAESTTTPDRTTTATARQRTATALPPATGTRSPSPGVGATPQAR
jgi:hypothetical protein